MLYCMDLRTTYVQGCSDKIYISPKYSKNINFFILDMFIQVFMVVFFDRFLIILGGEGGCLDWFFIRLLTRDPPSEVCSMLR